MKAIFNSRVIDTSKPLILSSNRAFCYGDGLFETIVTGNQRIDLIGSHLGRLKRGCDVLGIEFPEALTERYVRNAIDTLSAENNIEGDVRTKLMLWRDEGGLYAPEQGSASFFIECKETNKSFFQNGGNIGISKEIKNHLSSYSFAKRTSAMQYVLAGIERKKRNWDDIILLDESGNLSETGIANLFWIIGDTIFTPKLSTGCVEGVMRNTFLEKANQENISINEVCAKANELQSARCIFTTNASGIRYYNHFQDGERWYENPIQVIDPILKLLLQP